MQNRKLPYSNFVSRLAFEHNVIKLHLPRLVVYIFFLSYLTSSSAIVSVFFQVS